MKSFRLASALVAMLALSGIAPSARAQTPTSPPQGSTTLPAVTVTAAPTRSERYAQAFNFIQSHGAPARSGQLARWREEVCPLALGLSPSLNAAVARAVVARAAEVGAPVPRRRTCRANVEIIFTAEPQQLMDAVAKKREAYLGYHYVSQTATLSRVAHPIEARYLTATRNLRGIAVADVASGDPHDARVRLDGGAVRGTCGASRLTDCISSEFINVLIVVDGRALEGRPLGPVADYVAVLALSQPKVEDGCNLMPSILDLMSSACGDRPAAVDMTRGDLAYLKSLYATDLESNYGQERSNLAAQLVRRTKLGAPSGSDN